MIITGTCFLRNVNPMHSIRLVFLCFLQPGCQGMLNGYLPLGQYLPVDDQSGGQHHPVITEFIDIGNFFNPGIQVFFLDHFVAEGFQPYTIGATRAQNFNIQHGLHFLGFYNLFSDNNLRVLATVSLTTACFIYRATIMASAIS